MRYNVRIANPAEDDLIGIVEYIFGNNGAEQAKKVKDLLVDTAASLEQCPGRGRVVPTLRQEGIKTFRELIIKRRRIVYRVVGREVYIVAFLDSSRDATSLLRERAIRDC